MKSTAVLCYVVASAMLLIWGAVGEIGGGYPDGNMLFGLGVVVLTYPSGHLAILASHAAGIGVGLAGTVFAGFLTFGAGFIQWFIVAPRLLRFFRHWLGVPKRGANI